MNSRVASGPPGQPSSPSNRDANGVEMTFLVRLIGKNVYEVRAGGPGPEFHRSENLKIFLDANRHLEVRQISYFPFFERLQQSNGAIVVDEVQAWHVIFEKDLNQ